MIKKSTFRVKRRTLEDVHLFTTRVDTGRSFIAGRPVQTKTDVAIIVNELLAFLQVDNRWQIKIKAVGK